VSNSESSIDSSIEMPGDVHTLLSRRAVGEVILRTVGILALLGIAVMHVVQLVQTLQATPLLGLSFVALIGASVALAARLLTGNARLTWWASAILGVSALAGYAFTRSFSTPLDNQDVGNWACMLGLAALFVETVLVLLSGYAIAAHRAARSTWAYAPTGQTGAVDLDAGQSRAA